MSHVVFRENEAALQERFKNFMISSYSLFKLREFVEAVVLSSEWVC